MEASSSSSSSSSSLSSSNRQKSFPASASGGSSRWNYDVFLSFRGEDTRNNFTDHLDAALVRKMIITFKDDRRLKRGTEISPELFKAIEESRFSIVIFSKKYASSTWCLEELAKIVECMKTKDHTVIPIFYDVEPSVVRKQGGEFKKAFDKHQKNHDNKKVQRWRQALKRVANIVGYHIWGRPEAKLIEDIVNDIWSRLDFSSCDGDQRSRNLVGMDYHWEEMKALLEVESDDVRFIGVCGMGGIGKTTIARYVYDKISDQYEGRCFIKNVRHFKEENFADLQKTLLSYIMEETNLNVPNDHEAAANHIRRWSCRKRIIVVLDDVDKLEQLEMLAGNHNWFGSGSRIIITTRDQHVLRSHGIISSIYEVRGLKDGDALQLFHMNAFKNKQPKDGYFKLSMKIIHYVRGHPLALKVLGCHLCGRAVEEWNSALNRLRQVSSNEILETLRLSYDGLEELDKKIFLDIACFFKGKNKDWVMEILDSCDFDSTIGISVLIDRSLITISYNRLDMHDLLQEMGRAIVREQQPNNRGKWSRLWRFEDVYHVLTENRGTEYVEGIMFNKHEQRIFHLDGKSFSGMINLRLLKISNIDLSEDLEYLSNELRFLKWRGYPSNYLPSNFLPRKLFALDLCHSRIKYLWKGMETFEKLKTIKLSYSHNLMETPDFTWVPNLEMLDLEGCTRLRKVHDSVGLLKRLNILNLKGCKNLVSFPSNVSGMKLLKILNLQGCSKLDQLPQNLGELEVLEELDAGETAIRQVPPSISRLWNLEYLSFCGCKVQGWRSWFLPRKYLNSMCLSLPRLLGLFSLKTLDLNDCRLSEELLPSDLGTLCSLKELKLSNNNFVSLPNSIKRLSKLKILCLENCPWLQSLPELPPEVIFLGVEDCISLEDVSNALRGSRSRNIALHLLNCFKLHENQNPENGLAVMLLKQRLQQPFNLSSQFHIRLPGSEIPRWFRCRNEGNSVEIGLPPNWFSDEFMGIAMCGVFALVTEDLNAMPPQFVCTMSIMRNSYSYRFTIPTFTTIKSNHLWLAYVSRVKFERERSHQLSSYLDYCKKKELDPSYKRPDESDFYVRDYVSVRSSTCIHARFEIDGAAKNSNSKVIECGIRLIYKQDIEFQDLPATEVSTSDQNHDCSTGHCCSFENCHMPTKLEYSNIRRFYKDGVDMGINTRPAPHSDSDEKSITEGSLDGTEDDSGREDFHEDPSGGNSDWNVNKGLWLLATAVRFFNCGGCCGME